MGAAAHGDALQVPPPARVPALAGYAPDGTAGLTRAFPLSQVKLLAGAFQQNQRRNTDYLLFLDADRLLRSFRLNYGVPTSAQPCGGWEAPHGRRCVRLRQRWKRPQQSFKRPATQMPTSSLHR